MGGDREGRRAQMEEGFGSLALGVDTPGQPEPGNIKIDACVVIFLKEQGQTSTIY
jgi:hypothetical protein